MAESYDSEHLLSSTTAYVADGFPHGPIVKFMGNSHRDTDTMVIEYSCVGINYKDTAGGRGNLHRHSTI